LNSYEDGSHAGASIQTGFLGHTLRKYEDQLLITGSNLKL